jgi:hypothetical protein
MLTIVAALLCGFFNLFTGIGTCTNFSDLFNVMSISSAKLITLILDIEKTYFIHECNNKMKVQVHISI